MTESQILALAWRLSPWAGFILALVYIVANRVGPIWLAEWRETRKQSREAEEAKRRLQIEEEKEERKSVITLYERLVAQSYEMVQFISSATEAIHSSTRSLDANTQQIYHLTQAVERGPRCPLPDCPFMPAPARVQVDKDKTNDTTRVG